MNDGGAMDVFNRVIVRGTGRYKKYTGTTFKAMQISLDPNWISEITLSDPILASSMTDDDDDEHQTLLNSTNTAYYLRVVGGDVGFSDLILDYDTKEEIGSRFQNHVLDPTGKRIGTNQGYRLDFPTDGTKYTEGKPFYLANRLFYLEDGELNVLNERIISASGIYKKYTGGFFKEKLISANPFTSDVTLTQNNASSTASEGVDENIGKGTTPSEGFSVITETGILTCVQAVVLSVLLGL